MSLLGVFNWLDVVLLALLVIGVAIGFRQGLLRQILGLAALYIGAILGAQYYTVIAGWFRFLFPNLPVRFVNALGFLIILLAVTSLINWLAYDAYQSTHLHIFPVIDRLVGSLLGFLTAAILISLLFPIVAFASGEQWPWAEGTRLLINYAMETSRLIPFFDQFKPELLNALGPWLPGGLPSLFNL